MRIEEMEEKEQVLQARIEALQADNDFTNERLAALQGTNTQFRSALIRLKHHYDQQCPEFLFNLNFILISQTSNQIFGLNFDGCFLFLKGC